MQGQDGSSYLKALGNSCGVDVQGLFAKYSSQKENATTRGTTNRSCSVSRSSNEFSESHSDGGGQLDICSRCHGLGLVQVSYNFQTRDVNCDHCNGDGVIAKRPSSRR